MNNSNRWLVTGIGLLAALIAVILFLETLFPNLPPVLREISRMLLEVEGSDRWTPFARLNMLTLVLTAFLLMSVWALTTLVSFWHQMVLFVMTGNAKDKPRLEKKPPRLRYFMALPLTLLISAAAVRIAESGPA